MKIRNPWLIRLAAFLASIILRCWLGTLRYRIRARDRHLDPNHPGMQGRFIYAFWHESILFSAGWKTKAPFHVLISRHADGELIAQVAHHLGFSTVRGSSTRGGTEALRQLVEKGRHSHLMVTPDGPRGPRRQLQDGVIYLASRTGLPIVPVGVGFGNAWRARSWDRFALPKPWSQVCCAVGEIVRVPPDLDRRALESYRLHLQKEMLAATAVAETWANGEAPRRPILDNNS